MTTIYQAYPAEQLPLPSTDFSSKPVTNTVQTQFTSGRVRRRRLGYGKYHTVKLTWSLSPEEYDFFMGWWEFVLSLGTMPFIIEMATGAIFGEHTCQLIGEPDCSLNSYFWRVSCDAVLLKKPEMAQIDVIYAMDPTAPAMVMTIPGIMQSYYTRSW